MHENYQAFVERMISRYEGGYGWDKADSGGPTKYGITCWDLAAHRHQVMDSMQRWAPIVRAMPLSEADEIYATKYATATRFDDLASGADCVLFDFGVNSGPSRAVKFAQQIAGVNADGLLGPITLQAINNYDTVRFINELCDARMVFLRKLRNWRKFGGGWTARVADLRKYALALVHDHSKLAQIEGAHAKGYVEHLA